MFLSAVAIRALKKRWKTDFLLWIFSLPFLINPKRQVTAGRFLLFRSRGRVGKGISARAAHGTVRESLPSYGSCYSVSI
jgi:hypothetical protein